MNSMKPYSLTAAAATLLLAACGGGGDGGGGGGGVVQPPPLAIADLQGYWTGNITGTALGTATKARAIVLDDGKAWIFLHDGSQPSEPLLGLATASATPTQQTFSGTGKRYPASGAAVTNITIAGNGPAASAFTVNVTSGTATGSVALTYSTTYDVAANQAHVVGNWRFTKAGGTVVANWSVGTDGTLTGTSTLGCTYGGSVRPRNATKAIFAVAVTETCTTGVKQLAGVGRLNTDRSFLTFGLTTTDGAEAEAFAAEKQ